MQNISKFIIKSSFLFSIYIYSIEYFCAFLLFARYLITIKLYHFVMILAKEKNTMKINCIIMSFNIIIYDQYISMNLIKLN